MSRHTHTHRSRGLAVAGLLATAYLALPSIGAAQSAVPERALLNQVSFTPVRPSGLRVPLAAPADPAVGSAITGEQALLGHTPADAWGAAFESSGVPAQRRRTKIDGEAALLGKWD